MDCIQTESVMLYKYQNTPMFLPQLSMVKHNKNMWGQLPAANTPDNTASLVLLVAIVNPWDIIAIESLCTALFCTFKLSPKADVNYSVTENTAK